MSLKPAHFSLANLIRPNILALQPYRCARDDYQSGILLDANENAIGHSLPAGSFVPHDAPSSSFSSSSGTANGTPITGSGAADPLQLHRYPDPALYGLKERLVELRQLESSGQVFLGVGSDEVLDLIQRICGAPGKDKVAICPPTYGMYSVCAAVNDLGVVKVPLKLEQGEFSVDTEAVLSALRADQSIKILFLCSPGNPTGTLLKLSEVRRILDEPGWSGLVVVDEAYIDFAEEEKRVGSRYTDVDEVSAVSLVKEYANVIVTQTLSKAFGLAAIRLGIAYAHPELIQIMNNTKAPYNISVPTAYLGSRALTAQGLDTMRTNVRTLIENRTWLIEALQSRCAGVGEVLGGNDANFILIQVLEEEKAASGGGSGEQRRRRQPDSKRAGWVYKKMAEEQGLVVRNRASEMGCAGCLRITVGTKAECERCVELMCELLGRKQQ
ncbi:histidinol-phosphate transaminase [Tilletia horrida]|uniref:histidinol-phosphate transaminase n=1 Tax=Tilletia horrida TaxID=155126 RepID=A0AAN6JML8_9BASI|nr:histidinol-phosphate transaminase [Tilletia horrida]